MEITVFVDGRHPKDMLRSVSHELVHHAQNCRGEFDKEQTLEPGYAQKDPHLRRMEGEAYLLGNGYLVRDFLDSQLKENKFLTENKKMKNLTKEQLMTVAKNTLKRVMEEGYDDAYKRDDEPAMEENTLEEMKIMPVGGADKYNPPMTQDEICAKYSQLKQSADDYKGSVAAGGNMSISGLSFIEDFEKKYPAYKRCQLSEEVVEEEVSDEVKARTAPKDKANKADFLPKDVRDKINKDDLKESFTSKKDQLLFERLINKWAK